RSPEEMAKIETIVKSAVNFDPERGDKVEVANLAFEASRLDDPGEETQPENWFARLSRYAPALKYGFAALFVLLTFLFVVRPIVRWLTSSVPGGIEILNQLPRTVGEIEREYGDGVKSLPFREMASQMIAKDNKASVETMRTWLRENS
ncbi:MAG: hypothetical protein MUP74_04655, partial [Desulfobacterales bacterium]|nr:hypothetical protein [Desulfobacterales bacterium]